MTDKPAEPLAQQQHPRPNEPEAPDLPAPPAAAELEATMTVSYEAVAAHAVFEPQAGEPSPHGGEAEAASPSDVRCRPFSQPS